MLANSWQVVRRFRALRNRLSAPDGVVRIHGIGWHLRDWWEPIPENYKQGFIAGYTMGTLRAHSLVLENCEGKLGDSADALVSYAALRTCLTITFVKTFDFSSIRPGQLADGIDEFYKDSRNKSIDINFALLYARDKLKGKPVKELDDELTLWRQAASH